MKIYFKIGLMSILTHVFVFGEDYSHLDKPAQDLGLEKNRQHTEVEFLNIAHKQKLMRLAHKFAPQLREHEDEKYPLTNVRAYLSEVGLAYYKDGERTVLIEPGFVTMSNIMATAQLYGIPILTNNLLTARQNDNLRFFIPQQHPHDYERIAASQINKQGQKNEPMCYAYAHYVKNNRDLGSGDGSDDRTAIEIVYIFFNAYNGTNHSSVPGVSSMLGLLGLGHHEADFEHLTIRLNDDEETIEGVHYSAHGTNEGVWYFNGTTDQESDQGYKLTENGQVIGWSARETHGIHNRAGVLSRTNATENAVVDFVIGTTGLLNEQTGDGNIIDCQNHLSIINPANPQSSHPWLSFVGRWGDKAPMDKPQGTDGPPGPIFQKFWTAEVQNPETWLNRDERLENTN